MKLTPEPTMITPRVRVIAHLRPAQVSPEIWPLRVVALIALFVIALSALCGWLNEKATRATDSVMRRIEAAQARLDEDQRIAELIKGRGCEE